MTEEDEAFNEIERQAKQRKESVMAQLTPLACERCKQLEEQVYDLLGQLKVANLKWSVAHPWVGLTDDEMYELWLSADEQKDRMAFGKAVETKLKEKNT